MTGDMLPWFTTFLIGVVVSLILLITTVMLHRMVRTETTSFQHCVCGEEGGEPAALAGGEPRLCA